MNITPIDMVLRQAEGRVGAGEIPVNSNAGPYVERVLKRVGLKKGDPWCAAEVADIGVIAIGPIWPLPLTGRVQVLYDFAVAHQIMFDTPQRGDVFTIWHPELGRFAHAGFVLDVPVGGLYPTHEGNTSGGGSREGWLSADRQRHFAPKDRFIRWADLIVIP